MSKIFITGVNSFIGKDLAEYLLKSNYEVHGLCRYTSDRDFDHLLPGVTIHQGDILHYADLENIIKEIKPDVVVHLGAQTSVYYSFGHESEVMQSNFIGTHNLAKICATLKDFDRFIFASSVETYGNQKHFPISEDQPLHPASPYGVAKASSEIYLRYLNEGYKFPLVMFRSTNTYGRKRCHNFVIEHIIYDMLTGNKEIHMGLPYPIRDYLHIEDEVTAYLKVIEADISKVNGQVYNTGTGVGISVEDLFNMIAKIIRSDTKPVWNKISARPFEIKNLTIDATKLINLGWKIKYPLDRGLEDTINWWKHIV
jgi:nucleoside-diphosphate-sugar epimerase